jgi:hypothetical protein
MSVNGAELQSEIPLSDVRIRPAIPLVISFSSFIGFHANGPPRLHNPVFYLV